MIGGFDMNGTFVDYINYFNFKAKCWNKVKQLPIEGRAYFAACTVYLPIRNFTSNKFNAKILAEGIYIFGGQTNSGITNDLSIFTKRKTEYFYEKVETAGIAPCPRYQHTMNYCDSLNVLIVYGGKNEAMLKTGKPSAILNDMYILSIDILTWTKIDMDTGAPLPFRTRHSSDIVGNKLYIFGGTNDSCISEQQPLVVYLRKKKGSIKYMRDETPKINQTFDCIYNS